MANSSNKKINALNGKIIIKPKEKKQQHGKNISISCHRKGLISLLFKSSHINKKDQETIIKMNKGFSQMISKNMKIYLTSLIRENENEKLSIPFSQTGKEKKLWNTVLKRYMQTTSDTFVGVWVGTYTRKFGNIIFYST